MANPYKRLYNIGGRTIIRTGLTAIDAGTWVPTADAEILDAREWEKIKVYPDFVGSLGGAETMTVELLIGIPGDSGREWLSNGELPINAGHYAEFTVDGHLVSFRLKALALGTATSVSIRATGLSWLRPAR